MSDSTEIQRRELDELFERYRNAPDSYVFVLLADACRKIHRLEEALEICEQGVARHPQYASGYVVKGKCLCDLGHDEAARRTFEHVLTLDENNLVALKYLGKMDADAGRYESARHRLQHILALDPDNREIRQTIETIDEALGAIEPSTPASDEPAGAQDEHDLEADFAAERITLGEDIETSDELATMTLADIFASQGYNEKARRIYGELLRQRPDSEMIRHKLSRVGGSVEDVVAEGDKADATVPDETAPPTTAEPAHTDTGDDAMPHGVSTVTPDGAASSPVESSDRPEGAPRRPLFEVQEPSGVESSPESAVDSDPGASASSPGVIELPAGPDVAPRDERVADDVEPYAALDGEVTEGTGRPEGELAGAHEADSERLPNGDDEATDEPSDGEQPSAGDGSADDGAASTREGELTSDTTGSAAAPSPPPPPDGDASAPDQRPSRRPIDEAGNIDHFKRWLSQMKS